jgi:hypothetical protein
MRTRPCAAPRISCAARHVIADGRAIAYDTLVLATGATHGYFGHEEWAVYAPGLKSVVDATSIRSRILDAFEKESPSRRAYCRHGRSLSTERIGFGISCRRHRLFCRCHKLRRIELVMMGEAVFPAAFLSFAVEANAAAAGKG